MNLAVRKSPSSATAQNLGARSSRMSWPLVTMPVSDTIAAPVRC